MTPTEFLQKRNIVSEDKTDLIIGFDNGTKESLIEILKSYHQAKLKLLGIADVLGRSEQLVAFCEWLSERDFTCDMTNPEDWVDIYLKSK